MLAILSEASAVIAEGEVLQLMTANDTETTEADEASSPRLPAGDLGPPRGNPSRLSFGRRASDPPGRRLVTPPGIGGKTTRLRRGPAMRTRTRTPPGRETTKAAPTATAIRKSTTLPPRRGRFAGSSSRGTATATSGKDLLSHPDRAGSSWCARGLGPRSGLGLPIDRARVAPTATKVAAAARRNDATAVAKGVAAKEMAVVVVEAEAEAAVSSPALASKPLN